MEKEMKKVKRRRFLLFVTQVGAAALIGSASKCSREKVIDGNNENDKKKMFELRKELLMILESGKEITLKWNCGGDEAIVTIYIDGKRVDYNDSFAGQLDIYIVNYLNLPSIGELDLEGEGKLIEDEGAIYIEYESIMKRYMDYGERGEKSEWVEVNKKYDLFSGTKELFIDEKF